MTLNELYQKVCQTPSDIYQHLPYLKTLASQCNHVTEFGMRSGASTTALLAGQPKTLISYDIDPRAVEAVKEKLQGLAGETIFDCQQGDTLRITIEPTDLLFIDTLHTYAQLKRELDRHGNSVQKYLVFHDTESFGDKGEDGSVPGLKAAIFEYLHQHPVLGYLHQQPEWALYHQNHTNNGLMVLRRS